MSGDQSVTTTSDQILAAGAPLELNDGRVVRLKYDMRGLKALEDAFGSVSAVQDAISSDGTGKQFGPFVTVLRCGLHREGITSDDELIDLLDVHRLPAYGEAVAAAFAEAFPTPDAPADGPGNVEGASLPAGPGLSGTTQPPSRSAVLTGTSG